MLLGIEIKNIDYNDLAISTIITNPDNPYFKTQDKALFKHTKNWSDIRDGDFILLKKMMQE